MKAELYLLFYLIDTMAFKNHPSLHLTQYESAYTTTAKVVETTVSKISDVGFKIPTGHVERVTRMHFQEMELKQHVNTLN